MKQMQINLVRDPLVVDTAPGAASEPLKVVGYGPLTVACQLSISASDSPGTASGQLQGSIDGTNFFNVGSPVTISADGELVLKDVDVAYAYYRVNYPLASGEFTVTEQWFVYGETI